MTDEQDPIYDPRKSKTENAASAAKEVFTADYSTWAWLTLMGLNLIAVGILFWLSTETGGYWSWVMLGVGVVGFLEVVRQIGMRVFTGW